MKLIFIALLWIGIPLQALAFDPSHCEDHPLDLLVLGDSQTGANWATAYFGNFLQSCLKANPSPLSFAIYGRGGTEPIHWLSNSGLDPVDTIYRDPEHPHANLGGADLPVCKKRLSTLLSLHHPKRVLLFFGDNLLTNTPTEIKHQFQLVLDETKKAGILPQSCFLLTPTFEMSVSTKRNVPSKSIENTKKVITAIEEAALGRCRVINGLSLMHDSSLVEGDKLKRIGVPGTAGCFGAASNDNIHCCGEAAQEFARLTCSEIRD